MKVTDKILGGLTMVLMICRLLFVYPFSSLLISIGCLLLSLLYLFFGFALFNGIRLRDILKKKSYEEISTLRMLLTIIIGFVLSMLIIYILFKFQMWPYGQQGLQISLTMLLIIIIVVLIKYVISKDKFYFNFLIRLFTIGVYGLILFFISNENLLEMRYKNFPEYIKAEKKLMQDPENKYLQQKANEERQKMHLSEN
jgi:magnesium-transporting ATPase (P-type)